MNAALTLQLQGDLANFIQQRAAAERLPLDDARQEAWLAISQAVQSYDQARGNLEAWAKLTIQNHLHRLAYGHDGDPLKYAASIDEDLADKLAGEHDDGQDTREIPALSGVYGRIRALALQGLEEKEIANVMGYSKRRIQQLLSDKNAILDAMRMAGRQGDLFGGVQA